MLIVLVDRACFPCSSPREQEEGAGTEVRCGSRRKPEAERAEHTAPGQVSECVRGI